jgi:hypothetical protein
MSSVCSCSCGLDDGPLGSCVMRNRTARTIPKSGNKCPNCGHPVEIGQRCIDYSGLYPDDYGGFFNRFHEECFELMELFAERLCGGEWCYPFDIEEAAEHAFANSDDPYWREWLEIYERTWAWVGKEQGDE